jgi:hypothetical protein
MKKAGLAFLVAISSLAVAPAVFSQATAQSAKPSAQERARPVNPAALQLKPEIAAQHQRIQLLLPAQTKQKLARMVPDFERQVRSSGKGTDVRELASAEIRRQFPNLTPQ